MDVVNHLTTLAEDFVSLSETCTAHAIYDKIIELIQCSGRKIYDATYFDRLHMRRQLVSIRSKLVASAYKFDQMLGHETNHSSVLYGWEEPASKKRRVHEPSLEQAADYEGMAVVIKKLIRLIRSRDREGCPGNYPFEAIPCELLKAILQPKPKSIYQENGEQMFAALEAFYGNRPQFFYEEILPTCIDMFNFPLVCVPAGKKDSVAMASAPYITKIHWCRAGLPNSVLRNFTALKNFHCNWGITSEVLNEFPMLPYLQDVHLCAMNGKGFYDCDLTKLNTNAELKNLDLAYWSIVGTGFKELSILKNLKSIHLSTCFLFTGEGIQFIESLEEVWLNTCDALLDEHVGTWNQIKSLWICFCKNIATLNASKGLKGLKSLKVRDCSLLKSIDVGSMHKLKKIELFKLTTDLQHVGEITSLTEININRCKFQQGLDFKSRLRLQSFYLCNSKVRKISNLDSATQLTMLSALCCSDLMDTSFQSLSKLTNLQVINFLGMKNITDNAFLGLSMLKDLHTLNLCSTKVRDPILNEIKHLTTLEYLYFRDCPMTDSEIENCCTFLPVLKRLFNTKQFVDLTVSKN